MKRSVCLCLLFAVLSIFAYAETPDSELMKVNDWVYDALVYLSLEAGQTTLGVNAPASLNEMRLYLNSIPFDGLSRNGQRLYREIADATGPRVARWQNGPASVTIKPVLSATACYRQDSDAYFGFDSIARFNETKPLLSLPILIHFTPAVTLFTDFSVGKGFWSSSLSDNYTSIPLSSDSFDMNFPKTAYLSAGNSFFTAVIGRGRLNIGRTLSGSMILSDSADRLDYASLVLYSSRLRMSMTPIELAPDRFAYFHELSARPLQNLSISISEASVVNSTVDLRYLNPFMVFHSYAGWRDDYAAASGDSPVGSQFAMSADYVPIKGLRLYGQIVMNQFQTSYELDTSPGADQIPNSFGGLAGFEFVKPWRDGFVTAAIEGVYANPWLYILSNHAISYYWTRKELVAPSGYPSQKIQGWLGSPFGPDTIACIMRLTYDAPARYKLSAQYRFVCKGGNGDSFLADPDDDYYPDTAADAQVQTPSGTTLYQNSITVSGSRKMTEHLEVEGKLGYSIVSGAARARSFDASCAVSWLL